MSGLNGLEVEQLLSLLDEPGDEEVIAYVKKHKKALIEELKQSGEAMLPCGIVIYAEKGDSRA